MAGKQGYPEPSARFSNGLASPIIRGLCHFCSRDFHSAGKEYAGVHPRNWVFLMLCFLWTPMSPTCAQSQTEGEWKTTESEVQLRISTSSAKFYTGEVIPLDLAFSSAIPKRYQINLARYDRSGRMSYEQFIAEPKEATRDPLYLYFNSTAGFLGCGLTNFEFLS